MSNDPKVLAVCCLITIAAMLVVGAVSHVVLRHIIQTSPFWLAIALAARRSPWTKWVALPCFGFWLVIVVLTWLFLLGWSTVLHGTYSATEIAMTIVVGAASIVGIFRALYWWCATRWPIASAISVGVLTLQIGVVRLSLVPQIAHR